MKLLKTKKTWSEWLASDPKEDWIIELFLWSSLITIFILWGNRINS